METDERYSPKGFSTEAAKPTDASGWTNAQLPGA